MLDYSTRLLLTSVSMLALVASTVHGQQINLDPIVVKTPLDNTVVTTTRVQPRPQPAPAPAGQPPAPQAVAVPTELPAIATGFVAPSAVDVLSGSSALDKSQLDQQFQAARVGEIVRTMPGMAVQQTARDPGQAINIRGLQDFGRVNVLIDGMRQNFQRSGHSANGVFYIEPEMVKRVDVTRGPTATVYGSGAIGGVVNFDVIDADDILRAGEMVAMRIKTRYQTNGEGPFGSATGAMRTGNFDIVGQMNGLNTAPYKDGGNVPVLDSGQDVVSGMMRARWRPAVGHQITGTYIDYNADFVDRPTATSATRYDSTLRNTSFNVGYTFARPDTPLLDLAFKLYRTESDLEQQTLTGTNTGRLRGFNIVTDGIDVSNTSRFDWGPAKLVLTYGMDAFRDTVFTFDQNISAFSGSATTFTPGGERQLYGGFLQAHLKMWKIVDIIGAARYDNYAIEGSTASLQDERISPKLTVGVTPVRGITLYGTYAEGFRAPAVTETLVSGTHATSVPFRFLPNPNLLPEVAHNLEAGINFKFEGIVTTRDAFRAKIGVYENKIEDYIDGRGIDGPGSNCFTTGFPCLPTSTFQYVNFTNVTIQGAELEAAYDARAWFLIASAHHIRGADDQTGQPLLSIPADRVVVTLGTRWLHERLVVGGRVSIVDAQTRVPTGVAVSTAYNLYDAFAQYQWSNDVLLNLNVDNIFDTQYRQYRDQSNSPGLNARVGLTMRFGSP